MPTNGPTPGVLGSGARNGASGSISNTGNVNLTEYDAQEDQDCSEMEAMVAIPEDLQNCCWFLDSGATNHVTHDLGNLNSGMNIMVTQKSTWEMGLDLKFHTLVYLFFLLLLVQIKFFSLKIFLEFLQLRKIC